MYNFFGIEGVYLSVQARAGIRLYLNQLTAGSLSHSSAVSCQKDFSTLSAEPGRPLSSRIALYFCRFRIFGAGSCISCKNTYIYIKVLLNLIAYFPSVYKFIKFIPQK